MVREMKENKRIVIWVIAIAMMMAIFTVNNPLTAGAETLEESGKWFAAASVFMEGAKNGKVFDCSWYVDDAGMVERHEYSFDGVKPDSDGVCVARDMTTAYVLKNAELLELKKLIAVPKYGAEAKIIEGNSYEVCWKPNENGRILSALGSGKTTFGTDVVVNAMMYFDEVHGRASALERTYIRVCR